MRAGGRATEAGMAFQAAVGTWLAAHILARQPVGSRFGINHQALPIAIRLETGGGLDDIEVTQSDLGALHLQCKTTATISGAPDSPLGKSIGQLARWIADIKTAGILPDVSNTAALLAVHADAPKTLNVLESACRAFDHGGSWSVTRAQRNQAERKALDALKSAAMPAWSAVRGVAPEEIDLTDLARLFHLARFSMGEGDTDWREASRLLGRQLYGDDAAGDGPLRDLRGIVRDLIGSGAPADRDGLLRALRQRGHQDIGVPGYDADIAQLRIVTNRELTRLAKHAILPVDGGIPLNRECDEALMSAIQSGSLLVTGEPGAGKTGALVRAASALATGGNTIVFLSVDQFPGVAIASDLTSELGLQHTLPEALAAMPGSGRRILIIDALDAARGSPAESVFASLIEHLRAHLAHDWIVVASIRTFDLKNGRRFRLAFTGTPLAVDGQGDRTLADVCHFVVPRLTDIDLRTAAAASGVLSALINSAPSQLLALLRNVFNLSLAAELLAAGMVPAALDKIATQSALIDEYENVRLTSTALRRAASLAVAAMVSRRRLSVAKVAVNHEHIDAVISAGVLTEAGDLVSFAHHVLFDHIAGRFYLEWYDPTVLHAQLDCDRSTALLLAPALRFSVERLWHDDNIGRARIWRLSKLIFSVKMDIVLNTVVLRVIAENVACFDDVAGLLERIDIAPTASATGEEIRRLARFASMELNASAALAPATAMAWARIAAALLDTHERGLVEPARLLLMALFERCDLTDPSLFHVLGAAARTLLELAWTPTMRLAAIAPIAIEFVGKTFASAPAVSRTLLSHLLREPHFSQYAERETLPLVKQIIPIARLDPTFAVEIYCALYSQTINDSTATPMGSERIMPLMTTRRQAYEGSLYVLAKSMGQVLSISPACGTRALIDALIGSAANPVDSHAAERDTIKIGPESIVLRGARYEVNAWEETRIHGQPDDLLHQFVCFLRNCDIQAFEVCVVAASNDYATASVWARILGVGAERVHEVGALLWPVLAVVDLLEHPGTLRDAIRFAVAIWPSRSREERIAFETMVLDTTRFSDPIQLVRWHRILARFLTSVPQEELISDRMRTLRYTLDIDTNAESNEPLFRVTTGFVEPYDHLRDLMQRSGVDITVGFNRQILDASDSLATLVQQGERESSVSLLVELWCKAVALCRLVETGPALHAQIDQTAWARVASAMMCLASSSHYAPGLDEMPILESLFHLLGQLSSSPYPLQTMEASVGWSDRDVRVLAAQAWMNLAPRFGQEHPLILDRVAAILDDPVAAVRQQAAENLAMVGGIAADFMWNLAEQIASRESSVEVLTHFLDSLHQVSPSQAERCEAIIEIIVGRMSQEWTGSVQETKRLEEALGHWSAQLFVGMGRPQARLRFSEWANDPEHFEIELTTILTALRKTLFERYGLKPTTESLNMSERAQEAFDIIISRATTISAAAYAELISESLCERDKPRLQAQRQAAENIIHHAINQLYFGSGAYESRDEEVPGLAGNVSMRCFLSDYKPLLTMLGESHNPGTLHHLIDLYRFLIPAHPASILEELHRILLGRGAQTQYQFESLAIDLVVTIVQRYLADYRALFDDEIHSTRIVDILHLFGDAGWPASLQLLYDLPELLR